MPKSETSRECRRYIRKTLDRIERAGGLVPERRDGAARQRYAYATKEVGEAVTAISPERGWRSDREETSGQMERTARELEATAAWWQARAASGLVTPDLGGYLELIASKVKVLRERAEQAKSAERNKHAVRSFYVDSLSPQERAKYALVRGSARSPEPLAAIRRGS